MNDNWTNKSRSRRETLKSIAGVGGLMAGGAMLSACGSNGGAQQAEAQTNMQNVDFSDPAQSLRAFVVCPMSTFLQLRPSPVIFIIPSQIVSLACRTYEMFVGMFGFPRTLAMNSLAASSSLTRR